MILTCIAAAMSLGTLGQAPTKIEVPLTYVNYEVFDIMMGMYSASPDDGEATRLGDNQANKPKLPVEVAMSTAQKVKVQDKVYTAVFAQKDAHSRNPDYLWIDWNGDKTITEDESTDPVLVAHSDNPKNTEASTLRCFRPVSQPDKSAPIVFVVRFNSSISIYPAGGMQAVIPIGKGIKLNVIDTNRNGRYGDPYNPMGRTGSDILLLDRNGNGKFDTMDVTGPQDMENWETLPFMTTVQLGKDFYDLSIDTAGKTLTATPHQGPMATLKISGAKPSLLFYSSKDMVFATPVNGTFHVPASDADMIQLLIKVPGAEGKTWGIGLTLSKADKVLVSGKTTNLQCGLPLKLKFTEQHDAYGFSFKVDLADAGGHKIGYMSDGSGPQPPAPKLIIKDAKGKVVKNLEFAFG